jgi:glycine hydroxymethyltransferase
MVLCRAEHAKTVDSKVFPGMQGGPLMHVIAAKAVALREALTSEFKLYQQQIVKNAQTLSKALMSQGFRLTSGGTDNHLMLVDLRKSELTGKVAQETLDKAHITVNKNASPRHALSVRHQRHSDCAPAVTTRGMKRRDEQIADFIVRTLNHVADEPVLQTIAGEVAELCKKFPVYPLRRSRR